MSLVYINDDLLDRIINDFIEDDEDVQDGINRLIKFYDEHIRED